MPVPQFDSITACLPPYQGAIDTGDDVSPYSCTMAEVTVALGGTPDRIRLITGLLDLRCELRKRGVEGIQWLDGSFVEDKEALDGTPPKDIDVVTFAAKLPWVTATYWGILLSPKDVKKQYGVDHVLLGMDRKPVVLLSNISYWTSLFSHRRDGTWKGMLQVALTADESEDAEARTLLEVTP